MSTNKISNRQNVDRHNVEQTKFRIDKMSTNKMPTRQFVNRQNVDFFLWGALPPHTGYIPTKDMQTPTPQYCSRFNERCAKCWIELKINFSIYPILIFRVIVNIHRKLGCFKYKNDDNSKKKSENGFFIRFSTFRIFHVNFITFKRLFFILSVTRMKIQVNYKYNQP